MIRSILLIILLAFIAEANAKEVPANYTGNTSDALDSFVNMLINRFLERQLQRKAKVAFNHSALDETTLGKPKVDWRFPKDQGPSGPNWRFPKYQGPSGPTRSFRSGPGRPRHSGPRSGQFRFPGSGSYSRFGPRCRALPHSSIGGIGRILPGSVQGRRIVTSVGAPVKQRGGIKPPTDGGDDGDGDGDGDGNGPGGCISAIGGGLIVYTFFNELNQQHNWTYKIPKYLHDSVENFQDDLTSTRRRRSEWEEGLDDSDEDD